MNDELKKALGQVEVFRLKDPGPVALQTIKKYLKKRNMQLDRLSITTDKLCCWCNEMPLTKGRRKYCSDDCKNTAYMFCNPQSPWTKAWILINRQNCACAACGISFEDEIIKRIQRQIRYFIKRQMSGLISPDRVNYAYIGDNWGDITQVDHIQPIFKGGDGLGLANLQVLCRECHSTKTVEERR